ncbi:hypothetical protein K435DRAFT_837405 [Dendrothele bispora CBS 962.96]|uniref:DUF6534 domain-containing protein n=1 Tax=Dendrothele bispora (strain CBS 962.96) TaxID=1314807 RepID=A0A4S8MCG2_DENBC|nr:hypothetical protein K435DRAFT_837405 [Dendrothele bispora CBS 962.96]
MSAVNTSLPPIPDNIGIIAGPVIIGINLNWGLLGVAVVQIYLYHLSAPDDSKLIKAMVYILGTLELVQSVLASVDSYHWFAAGFGNMLTLDNPLLSPFDSPFLDGVIALMVQLFFCYRIWVLHRSYLLVAVVASMALTQAGGAMAVGIQYSQFTLFITGSSGGLDVFDPETSCRGDSCLWLGGSALADTLIAITMTYTLLRSRSDLFPGANKLILKIVRLIIETNTLTASIALLALICVLAFPDKPTLSVPVAYTLGKLYTNTFLAVLNNRLFLQQKKQKPMVTFASSANANSQITPGFRQDIHMRSIQAEETYDLGVHMHTEVFTYADTSQIPHDLSSKYDHSLENV